jgi:hypothetical protein
MGRLGIALLAAVLGLGFAIPAASAAPGPPWVPPVEEVSFSGQTAGEAQVTSAPDGRVTAVWTRSDGSNKIVQVATRPRGGIFGTPVNISAPGQDASGPQVAAARNGTVTVVWSRDDGSVARVQAATRPRGGSFAAPVDLSAPGEDAFNPQVTVAPDGTTTVVWWRFDGTDNRVQASTRPPGGAFGAPVNLSAPGESAAGQQITTASDGTTTAVWQREDGLDTIIQASTRRPGGSFGTPVDLSAPGQDAEDPQVTAAPNGRTTVVWRSDDGFGLTVQASTRPPGGSFGNPVDLSAPGQDAEAPQVTAAPDGTTTAVWESFDGADDRVQVATRKPGGSFGAPVNLSAPGKNAREPRITTAANGTTTAVWRLVGGSGDLIQARTRRPAGSFAAPVDLSEPGQIARAPQITTAPDGTATAVWERFNGEDFIIQSISTTPSASGRPRLANLKIKPKTRKVKRGRTAVFRVVIRNTGKATARNLKVCATGPKKLVKLAKCRKTGNLAAGRTKTVKIKVRVKRGAMKGRKAKITFRATASGGLKKSARAIVKVK